MTVDQQFNIVYERLQALLRQQSRLEKEAEKLREELAACQRQEVLAKSRIEELQQQVSILKLAAGEMSDKDKKAFERQVDRYIREIDKTIAYLSQ